MKSSRIRAAGVGFRAPQLLGSHLESPGHSLVALTHHLLTRILVLTAHYLSSVPFPVIGPDVLIQPVAAGLHRGVVAMIVHLTICIEFVNGLLVSRGVGQRYPTPATVRNWEVRKGTVNTLCDHQTKLYYTFIRPLSCLGKVKSAET